MKICTLVLSLITCVSAQEIPKTFNGASPVEWSQRLARSEMKRLGGTLFKDGAPKARWDYTSGLLAHSLQQLGKQTGENDISEYGSKIVESFIEPDGSIATYQQEDYNIDMVTPGRALLVRYAETQDEKLKTALVYLRKQLTDQPRTSDGGFWHKQRYPHQMWLDGLYMASPFLTNYGKAFNEPEAFTEVVRQILLMDKHSYDPASGLFYHGWDEKREQSWADPQTGRSPNFWGRAIGWYAMAIVDSLDNLPPTQPDIDEVLGVLRRLADGVARHQDSSGLWWQVVDQPGREGNYLETSATSMFVYAIAKGINRGYLPREKFLPVVAKGYEALIRDCLRAEGPDRLNLTRNCEVAGLGYTSSSGRPRDGSFDYYISEPIIDNDLKGVGPFILAGLEVQQLAAGEAPPFNARSWSDLEQILAKIKAPEFPAKDFPITDYGAKAGADASSAITAAIAACHESGGGRVIIPAGQWNTAAIHLKSGVNLHVSEGATLSFSTNPEDYPLVMTRWEGVECYNYSPLIYAYGQKNVAVTGSGTLDGQADLSNWWSWNDKRQRPTRQVKARDQLIAMGESGLPVDQRKFGAGHYLRPNFIQFYRCENILIEGITILRSPMWVIHPVLSQNVTVRNVNVLSHGSNNDGCNPESCRDVLIENCKFDTGDDCIAIKSGRNNDGRRVNVPSENIVVRGCVMADGHGGVVMGSEISGGVRNVFVDNCEMDSPNLDRALRFKSNAQRGGTIENIFMRNVRIGKVAEAVVTIDFLYEEGANGPHKPTVRNVYLEKVTSAASPRVLMILGYEGAEIENIQITDSHFSGLTDPDSVSHAGEIRMRNVTVESKSKKPLLNSVPAN
jgi:unsaturated rhamnogalacturonyl hydrolase